MKIKVSSIYDFHIAKERKRIDDAFTDKARERQLNILEAFAEGNLELVISLYNDLPYNDENECPEQEFVGTEISNFLSDLHCSRFQKIEAILNDKQLFVQPPDIKVAD